MDIPYTVTARPDTGLYNAKIGIWLFLASEVMLFGGLFSAYIFLRVGADYPWPFGTWMSRSASGTRSFLIASSVTVVMAWASIKLRKFGSTSSACSPPSPARRSSW
jgi:heme/copper-type cytochrome/quinol oxidase subunit 3